jgi:hypothetical protein
MEVRAEKDLRLQAFSLNLFPWISGNSKNHLSLRQGPPPSFPHGTLGALSGRSDRYPRIKGTRV